MNTRLHVVSLAIVALAADASTWSLDSLIARAVEHNPAVRAARSQVQAAQLAVSSSVALPDPTVSAGYFISEVQTRVGPQRAKVGLSQMLPWPGSLAARRSTAEQTRAVAREDYRATRAETVAAIRTAYAALYSLGMTVEARRESLELLKLVESVLLAKYATGTAGQAALLRLQVTMARLEDDIAVAESDAAAKRARLGALCAIDDYHTIAYPESLPMLRLPSDSSELLSAASAGNPMVGRARALHRRSQSMQRMSRQAFGPRFMLMTDYIITDTRPSSMVSADENGTDPWVVGMSLSLPLWARSKVHKVREAGLAAEAMDLMVAGALDKVEASLAALHADYQDAVRRVTLLGDVLVPKAQQALALTEEAYANGKASLIDVLDAQRQLLDLRVSNAAQAARRESAAARIDALGGAVFSLPAADQMSDDEEKTE